MIGQPAPTGDPVPTGGAVTPGGGPTLPASGPTLPGGGPAAPAGTANRPDGWRGGITAAGWAILLGGTASLGAGLALGYAALTGLGLAAGAALGLAAAINVLRLRVAIDRVVTPDRVTVGEPVIARLTVTNRGRLPVTGVDAIELLDGEPLRIQVTALAGGGSRVLDVPIPTPRRGLVRMGPMVVEHRDPLGLIRRILPLTGQAWLWVRPRVHPMRPLPLGLVPDFEGRLADNAPKGSTAFSALREYVPGDDPRHIHWRSTARAGTLMVREHVDTTDPTTTIALDTRAAVLPADLFEDAVELAASLATASLRVGHEVALAAPGEDRGAVAEAGGRGILDRLTTLGRSADGDPAGLARLAERAREGGALVVISGIEPDLVGRLAKVRRRFSRVIIFTLGAEPATVRRPGLAVIRAPSCPDAVAQWSRLLAGGPTGTPT